MAEIYDAILAYAESQANANDWTGVVSTLSAQSIANRNPEVWTVAKLITKIGQSDATLVCQTIKTAAETDPIMDGTWIAINTEGIHLFQDERQAMIDQLAVAGSWSEALKTAVKECGVTYSSPAEAYGLGTVTAADCEASWGVYLLEQEWSTLFNSNIVPNTDDRTNLVAALRSVANQLEA